MSPFLSIRLYNVVVGCCPPVATAIDNLRVWQFLRCCRRSGWQTPVPALFKRLVLKREAHRIGARDFVETGTLRGDTVWYFRKDFHRLFTIEVQPELARLAARRFRRHPHVRVIVGDSAHELRSIVPLLEGPTLFWLDGHYSGGYTGRGAADCPIWDELAAITSRGELLFTICIDDAASFGSDSAYPRMEELAAYVERNLPSHGLEIIHGIIVLHAKTVSARHDGAAGSDS